MVAANSEREAWKLIYRKTIVDFGSGNPVNFVNLVVNRCWKPSVLRYVPVFPVWYDSLVYLWRRRL